MRTPAGEPPVARETTTFLARAGRAPHTLATSYPPDDPDPALDADAAP
jgi:hypothetical protein